MNLSRGSIFLFFFLTLSLQAQPENAFRVQRLGTEDGMSHRWAQCITQDASGYFWIGTYDGLNRYDGHDFITYRPSASGQFPVTYDIINAIYEAADGALYINAQYAILKFNPATATFEAVHFEKDADNAILIFNDHPESAAHPTFFYSGYGLAKPFSFYELLPSGVIQRISSVSLSLNNAEKFSPVQCNSELAWFWNFEGTYLSYDLKTQAWKSFPVQGSQFVPIDEKGNVWIPADDQLESFELPSYARDMQWATFSIDPTQAIWLYSTSPDKTGSLYTFNVKDHQLTVALPSLHESEFSDHQLRIPYSPNHYVDKEGTLWLAGFHGLSHVRHTDRLFQHYMSKPASTSQPIPNDQSIRYLSEDASGLLYCLNVSDDHFYKINPANGEYSIIPLPVKDATLAVGLRKATYLERPPNIFSILYGNDGIIWLSTNNGLLKYEPVTASFQYYIAQDPALRYAIPLADHDDQLLYNLNYETLILNKNSGTSRRIPGLNLPYYQTPIWLPEENTFWAATDTGIVNINPNTLQIKPFRLYQEPRESRCILLYQGFLWIGTSRGLEKVDLKNFSHTHFDRSAGLPGNFIYSMVADGEYLFLGTSDGLCRFQVKTNAVKNFYVEDGLSHNEFNSTAAYKSSSGKIYMGGLNGINVFFPADLERKRTVPSHILLSQYSLYDADQDSTIFQTVADSLTTLTLSPGITSLNLYLALSSYIDPLKNQYDWLMEGLDDDWYHGGTQHVATYRHIPPGHYTFRARAADPFGNWSEKELSIEIDVLRRWYSRWWAWLIYSCLGLGVMFAFYRNQLRKRMEHAENLRLQELDTFKNRFFTNITHEFRTPLTVILGMTEKIQEEKTQSVTSPQQHALSLVRRNAESLLRLINQILDLAKLESHSLKINYVQGDVLPYLRYIAESLQSFANAQNLLLRVESSEGEIVMDYDPERLQQIVYNLISNAIKFTPGGGRVTLKAELLPHPTEQHQQQIKITVSDNGAGIPAEDMSKIFDRFYQADNLKKAKSGGTGIGLSLTKELVKAMNGEIMAASEVGKGTTMTVVLPISRIASESHQQELINPNAYSFSSFSSKVMADKSNQIKDETLPQLLLIEDNPDVVEYLIACLDRYFKMEYAYNGRAGIEKAYAIAPDIIISDVMMPEKDGFEVTNELKNDQRTSHIPIMLLTAKADVESRIAGLRRGADAYLAKPFHKEELLATLDNLLENRKKLQVKYLETAVGNKNTGIETTEKTIAEQPSPIVSQENEFLNRLKAIIEEHLSDAELDVELLCRKIGMGRTNLHNKLTALTGLSTTLFVRKLRLNKAKELLTGTDMNISEVAYEVGFNDPKFFSRVFSEEYGFPPSGLKNK